MANEQDRNTGVVAETAGAVRGQIAGLVTGALMGGVIWAAVGAVAGAIAAPFLGGDFSSFSQSLQTIGAAAGTGAGIGAVGGATLHAVTGAIVGAANARNPEKTALAQVQEKQLAYANGLMQGATLAKMEELEEQVNTGQWQDRVGKKNHPELFQDQVRQQQALAALAAMEPRGNA